jgi:ligand-binding sensor domain-containing protein
MKGLINKALSATESKYWKMSYTLDLRKTLLTSCEIILIIFLCQLPEYSYSQNISNIRFQNISTERGLSNSHVNSIYQDKQGFLWFLTFMGADRYNGYNFDYIIHNEEDTNSLSNSGLFCLYEDSD